MDRLLYRPFFTGIPGGVRHPEEHDSDYLLRNAGLNTGNFLFVSALRMLLGDVDDIYHNYDYYKFKLDEYDYFAISAANWINPSIDLGWLADLVEGTNLPCLVVGLGVQLASDGSLSDIPSGTKRFLSIVSERSKYVSVRGAITQKILAGYSIHNTWVTGCPSLLGHLLNRNKPDTDFKKADFSRLLVQGTRHNLSGPEIFSNNHGAKLNLSIYRLAFREKLTLLLQSEAPDIHLKISADKLEGNRRSQYVEYLNLLYNTNNKELDAFLKDNTLVFWDVDSWFDEVSKFSALISTRIHGVISGIISGVPSILLAHDKRTLELAQFHKIPYYDNASIVIDDVGDLERVAEQIDSTGFINNFRSYRDNFVHFFEANQVRHNVS